MIDPVLVAIHQHVVQAAAFLKEGIQIRAQEILIGIEQILIPQRDGRPGGVREGEDRPPAAQIAAQPVHAHAQRQRVVVHAVGFLSAETQLVAPVVDEHTHHRFGQLGMIGRAAHPVALLHVGVEVEIAVPYGALAQIPYALQIRRALVGAGGRAQRVKTHRPEIVQARLAVPEHGFAPEIMPPLGRARFGRVIIGAFGHGFPAGGGAQAELGGRVVRNGDDTGEIEAACVQIGLYAALRQGDGEFVALADDGMERAVFGVLRGEIGFVVGRHVLRPVIAPLRAHGFAAAGGHADVQRVGFAVYIGLDGERRIELTVAPAAIDRLHHDAHPALGGIERLRVCHEIHARQQLERERAHGQRGLMVEKRLVAGLVGVIGIGRERVRLAALEALQPLHIGLLGAGAVRVGRFEIIYIVLGKAEEQPAGRAPDHDAQIAVAQNMAVRPFQRRTGKRLAASQNIRFFHTHPPVGAVSRPL